MSDPSDVLPVRVVSLVLVSRVGGLLGRLPAFGVETPWWQEARPVVDGARALFGLDVTVLRLLEAERPAAPGGAVTYLAEVRDGTAVTAPTGVLPWHGRLVHEPLRQTWAEPGGPAADLEWADSVLAAHGVRRDGSPVQDRTWNLSSLWRLPLASGGAWLKVVPPFLAHEGVLLERLAGEAVPSLLGREGPRILMAELEGEDRYDAALPDLLAMVEQLVDLQSRWLDRADELASLGVPDWRGDALVEAIAAVVTRAAGDLSADDGAVLRGFVDGLPGRLDGIAACGLSDSLVHGDFHPGNVRGAGSRVAVLDWGDSGIGHPLLDQPAFLTRIPPDAAGPVRACWRSAWQRAVPGSDPARAARLLAPVAAARQAAIYRRFLDNIEPSERPYHQADVPEWLHRAAQLLRAEASEPPPR